MDCGVCLSFGGEGSTIGFRCKIVKAGERWLCSECGRPILKGEKYELASGFDAEDGNRHWNAKTCLTCAEIADALSCEGRWYGSGRLWDAMESVFGKLTSACFDKLKTPEAKSELRRRWIEWKGLSA